MGHREAKQEARRQAIIANAVALYRELGPDALRVRAISARTGISDATFFNYFRSRDGVFGEWAADEVDAAFRRAEARCRGGEGMRRVVRHLAAELADRVVLEGAPLIHGVRSMRLVPRTAEDAPARGRSPESDAALGLVEANLARGEIRSDVPAPQLAEMLRSVVLSALAGALAADPPPDARVLAERVRLAADVVLDGMRKRNERVRLDARAAPSPAS